MFSRLESIRYQQQQMVLQIEAIEKRITENEALQSSLTPKLSKLHKYNFNQFFLFQKRTVERSCATYVGEEQITFNYSACDSSLLFTLRRLIQSNNIRECLVIKKSALFCRELDTCQFRLSQLNVPQAAMDKVLQEVSLLADFEQEPLARILLQLTLRWQPDKYLSLDCTKVLNLFKNLFTVYIFTLNGM